jgi:hypothetical protein
MKRTKKKLSISATTVRPLDARVEVRGGLVLSATSCARYCICGPTAYACGPTAYTCVPCGIK